MTPGMTPFGTRSPKASSETAKDIHPHAYPQSWAMAVSNHPHPGPQLHLSCNALAARCTPMHVNNHVRLLKALRTSISANLESEKVRDSFNKDKLG